MTWYLGQGLLKSAPAFPKGLTRCYNADKDKMIPELIPPWPLPALPLCGVSLQQVEEENRWVGGAEHLSQGMPGLQGVTSARPLEYPGA